MKIEFTVPAVPVAQPRARATVGHDGHARTYNDPKHAVNSFKASVRHAAAEVYSGAPLNEPLTMELLFVFPRPKAIQWKGKPMPRLPLAGKKNDVDNLAKAVMDALNQRLFTDDGLICELRLSKWIASGDEQPHVIVRLKPLEVFGPL